MKHVASILVVLLFTFSAYTQTDNRGAEWLKSLLDNSGRPNASQKSRAIKYDFGSLWTETENSMVFGFIGDNYQRLRIKLISVTRQPGKPDTYTVTGKSMV